MPACSPNVRSENVCSQNRRPPIPRGCPGSRGGSAWRSPLAILVGALSLGALSPRSLPALVISEIMYHPAEAVDRPYEYIELYNEDLDPLDLSGFRFTNGVQFEFPQGAWLEGRSFVLVCADAAAVRAKYGLGPEGIHGDYVGSLDNGGERIELANPGGRTVVTVRYNDVGKWPAGADGTGHSLSLISPFLEVDDPDSWTLSEALGGTPMAPNTDAFATGGVVAGGPIDGSGFILRWLLLGPYTGASCPQGAALTRDWLTEGAGGASQTDLIWRAGQVVDTNYSLAASTGLHANAGTAKPTIRELVSFSDTINLNDAVWPPDPNNVMAYAFTYVDNVTSSAIAVDIACASDDAVQVLVNGASVHVNDVCRAVGSGGVIQDRAPATLAVGKNLIAVKVFEQAGGWSFRLRLERRSTGSPIVSRSQIQVTTDPDKGLLFGGGGTPIEPTDEDPPPTPGSGQVVRYPVVINEGLLGAPGASWIELYNSSSSSIDLSDHYLTDDPSDLKRSRLPAGTSIAAGGFLLLTGVQTGLDLSVPPVGEKRFVALVNAEGDKVLEAVNFNPKYAGYTEARYPDGDTELADAADPTPGVPNVVAANRDIVINEIMYNPIDGDPDKEYVELYNRGAAAVDLSLWRFSSGIDFTFPAGTTIPAGGYLVVARDPVWLRSVHGLSATEAIGPDATPEAQAAFGRLRDSGERITLKDSLGRTVDTVRYHDGGEWPRWADGFGSSLELIDPFADNRIGQAWDASDDSEKASVRQYTYVGRHIAGESELSILLLDQGIALVDDVSIIGGGIQNIDTPFIEYGETWRFIKGTAPPPADWTSLSFDDSAWTPAPTGIGYGDEDDATILTDMQNGYMTIFCRKTFTVADPTSIDKLILAVSIDDGFYAYLNGTQVASYNVSSPAFDASASTAVEPHIEERDISSHKGLLRPGTNVLAIQVHNAGIGSSDLSFNPSLVDRTTEVSGGSEQVLNGTFDTNTTGWMFDGTHVRSGRTTQSPIRGAGSLKILAAGRGDNKTNRIETPQANGVGLASLTPNQDLAISFRAKWIVGAQTLLTHGYEHEMAKAHDLAVPPDLGTPGRANSVTLRLAEAAGEPNLGPLIADVSQDPAVPGAAEKVTVTARVIDPDGVSTVTLRYSLTNPAATMTPVPMTSIGGDFYRAEIPGQPLGTTVVFFIEAQDGSTPKRSGRYPLDVARRTHPLVLDTRSPGIHDHRYVVYRHDERMPGTPYHSYRFWMTAFHENDLATRKNLSNDLVPGSFVYGADTIYYHAHTRFAGSPFARGQWGSMRVRMPRDRSLHGRHRKVTLEVHHSDGTDARERISHYLIRLNQGASGVPYSDLQTLVRWQVNGRTIGIREHVWVPDAQFLSFWYPGDDDGDFFEVDDRFVIDDYGNRVGNKDAELRYPPPNSRSDGEGENKENYRWFFNLRAKNGLDDYRSLIALAQLMDPSATGNTNFDAQVFDRVNVEEFLRIWTVRHNTDDWDTWGASRGKNCYLYLPLGAGRWELLPWDMELTYGNTGSFIIPTSPTQAFNPGWFGEVHRFLNRPAVKRMYYGILKEMVVGPGAWFGSGRLSPYMERLAAIGCRNVQVGTPGGFIDQRANLVRPRIQSVIYPQVRFTITTNGGRDMTVATATVALAGTTPAEVATIVVDDNEDGGTVYAAGFPTMTTWSMPVVELVPGVNRLTIVGFDLRGEVVDLGTINVTSTAGPWSPPSITSILPAEGAPGDVVEILGADFRDGLQVLFGSTQSPTVTYDAGGPRPDRILAQVPEGSGEVQVTVRNRDGQVSNGVPFEYGETPPRFIRGDANGDRVVDLSDSLKILLHLFHGTAIDCEDAADVDDNESLEVTDAIYCLDFLFRGGPVPKPPYPSEGVDPSGTSLGCER